MSVAMWHTKYVSSIVIYFKVQRDSYQNRMLHYQPGCYAEGQTTDELSPHWFPDRHLVERKHARTGIGRFRLADVHHGQFEAPHRYDIVSVGGQAGAEDDQASNGDLKIVWPEINRQMSMKVAKNDFTRKGYILTP